jgi:hypothetical protein
VKRVSVGLDWHPALGPLGQIAADKIIPDTPKFDGIISILMPYGRGTSASLLPSWARKLQSAIEADHQSWTAFTATHTLTRCEHYLPLVTMT